MANSGKGFICFDGYLKKLERLTDEEVGRLFRACMTYHATGEEPELDGREGMAFDFIRDDIDTADKKYRDRCNTNQENANKRWNDDAGCDSMRSDAIGCDRMPDDANDANKNKNNNKNNNKNITFIDDDDARAIADDQNIVLDAAENAGFQKSDAVRAKLIKLYAENGKDKMLAGIDSCVTHGAPNIAYLAAVLKGAPKKPPSIRSLPAQNYGQRDYSGEQEDAMLRMIRNAQN